jgi:DNA-binding NarL/FixJ family response regulator
MRKSDRKLRLLIADDHELVRHGTRSILRAHPGWRVVGEAVDGLEAVQKAQELKPDLAILDISMPKLDGVEATRRIVQVVPDTKVLILTMHESDQMVRRVLDAGARGYILKSDLSTALVRAVKDVARGKLSLTAKVSVMACRDSFSEDMGAKPLAIAVVLTAPREIEVIRLLAQGQSNKEIGALLEISTRTVESYRARIMLKLDLHSTAALVRYAIRNKIVEA